MIITGNIKLEQFRAEIVNPVVTVNQVTDNIKDQVCNVEIVMTVDGGSRFAHSLSGFDYSATGTWEDVDILNWVESEMYLLAGVTKKATIKTTKDKNLIHRISIKYPWYIRLWNKIKNLFK